MNNNLIKKLEEVQYILKIENIKDEDILINSGKNEKNIEEYFKNYFIKRDELLKTIKKNKNSQESILKLRNETRKIDIYNSLFKIFTNNENYNIIDFSKNNEQKNIYENILSKEDTTKISNLYNKSELYVYDNYKKLMENIPLVYLNLKNNGNIIFLFVHPSYEIIKFIYLCSLLFEEVYIIHKYLILCKNFKNDIKYLKTITNINQNDNKFNLSEKVKLDKIFKYLKIHLELDYNFKYELIIKKNKELYLEYFKTYLDFIKNLGLNTILYIKKKLKPIEKLINDKQKKKIKTYDDLFIKNLLNKYKIKNILIIGDYNIDINNSIKNKQRDIIKIKKEEDVQSKLNKLLFNKNMFDLIFLDNINDFNNLLFYSIFSKKLLNKNKLLIINNAHFNEINKCIIHINNTIKTYKKINAPSNYAIFLNG